MSAAFGLVVRFTLRPGAEAAFDQLTTETLSEIRAHEPGTLTYSTHSVIGSPQRRVFYELYADRAAFETHERQPHVRRFLAEREAHVADVDVEFLQVVETKVTDSKGVG